VYLHVGAPKTGTTFLQTLLWDHRELLRERYGVLFPGDTYDEHFLAGVDLQDGCFHGDPRPESGGAWERLARQARQWPGACVISHEVFAGAGPDHARRAVADLTPAQVHVVYTARDLARQLPSHWQEDVKHGATDHFAQWWDAVWQGDDQHPFARWFWCTDDLPDVVRRWGGAVGPDRFHLVTVPGQAGPNVLWERFCAVVGFDPSSVDLDRSTISNRSLGVAEVEVVRRVNEHLDGALSPAVHQHVVKGVLGHDTLTRYPASRRVALPVEHLPTVERTAGAWLQAIEASSIDVVGDVAELVPSAGPTAPRRCGRSARYCCGWRRSGSPTGASSRSRRRRRTCRCCGGSGGAWELGPAGGSWVNGGPHEAAPGADPAGLARHRTAVAPSRPAACKLP
jgi:hypothetical protein